MKMTDADVERVAMIISDVPPVLWNAEAKSTPRWAESYRTKARALLASLDMAKVPDDVELDDVELDGFPARMQFLRRGVKAAFGQMVDATSPDWRTYIREDLISKPAQGVVAQAARVIIHDYDRHHPMRTADYHDDDCICLRCAVDRLRALAGEPRI